MIWCWYWVSNYIMYCKIILLKAKAAAHWWIKIFWLWLAGSCHIHMTPLSPCRPSFTSSASFWRLPAFLSLSLMDLTGLPGNKEKSVTLLKYPGGRSHARIWLMHVDFTLTKFIFPIVSLVLFFTSYIGSWQGRGGASLYEPGRCNKCSDFTG